MSMTVGELVGYLDVDNAKFDSKVDQAGSKWEGLGTKFKGAGTAMSVAVTAPLLYIAGQAASSAAGVEASIAKTNTVFGDAVGYVQDWASQSAQAMGLTETQAAGLAANFGDLLVPMGFARDQAAEMATSVVGLSGALSAWTGGQRSAAEVSDILAKAMLGEREGLKELGISISEADVQARLAAKGQTELTGAALEQAKALATQELIFEKSKDAQAAFADSTETLYEKQLKAQAGTAQMKETLAQALTPAVSAVTGLISKLAGWFNNLPAPVQKAAFAFAGVAAATGPVLLMLPKLAQGIKMVSTVMRTVMSGNPYVLALMAIVTAVMLVIRYHDEIKAALIAAWNAIKGALLAAWNAIKGAAEAVWGAIKGFFSTIWDGISEAFSAAWDAVSGALQWVWDNILSWVIAWPLKLYEVLSGPLGESLANAFSAAGDAIKAAGQAVWDAVKTAFTAAWEGIKAAGEAVWGAMTTAFSAIWSGIKAAGEAIWNGMKGAFSAIWEGIKGAGTAIWEGMKSVGTSIWNGMKSAGEGVWNGMKGTFSAIWNGIKDAFGAMWDAAKGLWENALGWIKEIPGKIKNALMNLGSLLVEAGKAVIEGLWKGMKAVWEKVTGWLSKVGGWIKDLKGPIQKDAVLLYSEGAAIIEGLGRGMQSQMPALEAMLRDFTGSLASDVVVTAPGGGIGQAAVAPTQDARAADTLLARLVSAIESKGAAPGTTISVVIHASDYAGGRAAGKALLSELSANGVRL